MPTDDYIKRSDCLEAMKKAEKWWWNADDLRQYHEIIESIPAADVAEVRHGRWKDNGRCSECGFRPYYVHSSKILRFCPKCGAKMDKEEDNGNEL